MLPFSMGIGLAFALIENHSPTHRLGFILFIGAAMSVAAFPVLARILTGRGMLRTALGGLALTCAAIDDVLHWVHCARTERYTLITVHPKRGKQGIDDAGVLTRFRGIAVHDAWAPYDTYVDVEHQLCCAHVLRELQAVADTASPEADWCWAGRTAARLDPIMRKHNAGPQIARPAGRLPAVHPRLAGSRGQQRLRTRHPA